MWSLPADAGSPSAPLSRRGITSPGRREGSRGPLAERVAIARNAASSYGARALLGLSVLLVTPYLFRRLGTAGFGTWSVMFTVTTVFSLLEFVFSAGVTKFIAEYRAQAHRRDDLNTALGAGVTLM